MPQISVIVPVYNAELYLHNCIDSILSQTFSDFEVLLINDGSQDGSGRICDAYAENDDRIRVVHQKNGGASAARNTGLIMAKGLYISFLDADDALEETFFQEMLTALKHAHADVAVCDISVDGQATLAACRPDKDSVAGKDIYFDYCEGRILNRVFNKLYRRELLNGVYFPNGRDLMEDGVFTPQVLMRCRTIAYVPKILYKYSVNQNSLMHKQKSLVEQKNYYLNALTRYEIILRWNGEERRSIIGDVINTVKEILDFDKRIGDDQVFLYVQRLFIEFYYDFDELLLSNRIDKAVFESIVTSADYDELLMKYYFALLKCNVSFLKQKVVLLRKIGFLRKGKEYIPLRKKLNTNA